MGSTPPAGCQKPVQSVLTVGTQLHVDTGELWTGRGWLYLYGAGAAVDGWGKPVDCPIAVNQDVDIQGHVKLTVIAVGRKTESDKRDAKMSDYYPIAFHINTDTTERRIIAACTLLLVSCDRNITQIDKWHIVCELLFCANPIVGSLTWFVTCGLTNISTICIPRSITVVHSDFWL